MRILVVNGPNLNLLGTRRPDVYGTATLADVEDACRRWGAELGADVETYQSNHEGDLIDRLHAARGDTDGIVLNPAAYTHTSYALHDAVEAVEVPTVEIHISNVEEREEWRRRSVVRPACVYTIYGRGVDGYRWAIRHLVNRARMPAETIPYGPAPDQVLDLRLPDGPGPHPAAVLVHGGRWHHTWGRDTTESLAVALTLRGLATANIEVRRLGTGGGWPASVEDVVAASAAAASHPAVDADRIVLVGQSSGAHLALLAADRAGAAAVVSSSGLVDLEDYAGRDAETAAAVEQLLAGAAAADASPLRHPPAVPVVLVHGDADTAVPLDAARRFAQATGSRLVTVPGGSHGDPLDPDTPLGRAVIDAVVSLGPGA